MDELNAVMAWYKARPEPPKTPRPRRKGSTTSSLCTDYFAGLLATNLYIATIFFVAMPIFIILLPFAIVTDACIALITHKQTKKSEWAVYLKELERWVTNPEIDSMISKGSSRSLIEPIRSHACEELGYTPYAINRRRKLARS